MSKSYRIITQPLFDHAGNASGSMAYKCIYCGEGAQCWDHVIPKKKGGSDESDNLVPCCLACNSSKGDRPLETFLAGYPVVMNRVTLFLAGKLPAHTIGKGDSERLEDCFITRQGEKKWRWSCRPHPRHHAVRYHLLEDSDGGDAIHEWQSGLGLAPDGFWLTHGTARQLSPEEAMRLGYRYIRPITGRALG